MKINEGAFDLTSLMRGHELGCLDAVAFKPSKFGGLSAMHRARDLAVHLGAEICAECTWGSGIVTAASLHFAVSTPHGSSLNSCDLSGCVVPQIALDCPKWLDGRIAPPEGAGLGVTSDLDIVGTPILELA